MDRRFLSVLGASLLFALVVSAIFYQMVTGGSQGARSGRPEQREAVVAARALPVGIVLKRPDVKLVKLSAESLPKDGFLKLEDVLDRAVMSSILPEEPLREARLASRGAGSGLATVIPDGMRAVAVRVNDVVGVAGFVLPGMRVDVLVTGQPPNIEGKITRTILQDILVLSAGQTIEPDVRGKAINAPVVTLLVSPAQAEVLTLATEGRIQLVLRNSGDRTVAQTNGRDVFEIYGRRSPSAPVVPAAATAVAPRAVPAVAPPPPAPPEVVVFRGSQRTVEQVPAAREPRS